MAQIAARPININSLNSSIYQTLLFINQVVPLKYLLDIIIPKAAPMYKNEAPLYNKEAFEKLPSKS